ncbi:hypothetical protein Bca52824_000612 [Brassica carinata]|uniref:RPW8 domain-containing protein n=1 Tax=Brassica carinata TaxID=52824 RepID=A0A8X7WHI7_BRACI|nr:hypothetical protein Bca52824_000612 [Brassica carinata]
MPIGELVAGAALGLTLQVLHEAIKKAKELRRRNLLKKFRYKSRVEELETSLRWMVDVDVQVNQWLDIKKLTTKMSEMNTKLEQSLANQQIVIVSRPIKAYHKVVIKLQQADRQGKIKKARVRNLNQGLICTFDGVQEQEPKIVRSDS